MNTNMGPTTPLIPPMTKEQVIAKMVSNYYLQGGNGQEPTLEEYLRGIMFSPTNKPDDNPWGKYTEADLDYGLSLGQK